MGRFFGIKIALKCSNFKALSVFTCLTRISAKNNRPPLCRSKASIDFKWFTGSVLGIG